MIDVEKAVGYVEVNIAAALVQPDGAIVNGDLADVTIAFYIRTMPPPRPLTEEEIKASVARNLRTVSAAIEAMLLANGAVHGGQPDEPLVKGALREVGQRSMPGIRVILHEQPQSGAKPS